jgi:hypothetical protein
MDSKAVALLQKGQSDSSCSASFWNRSLDHFVTLQTRQRFKYDLARVKCCEIAIALIDERIGTGKSASRLESHDRAPDRRSPSQWAFIRTDPVSAVLEWVHCPVFGN